MAGTAAATALAPAEGPAPVAGARAAGPRYLPELDALRGLAIAMVYSFHVDGFARQLMQAPRPDSLALALVHGGFSGVDLFFVLSGFLLSLPFLAERAGGRRLPLRQYFGRRARRILPAYVAGVAAVTVLYARSSVDLWRGLPYLVFAQSFSILRHHDGGFQLASNVWWSLATEVQFYVALGLLAYAFRRGLGRLAAATLVAYAVFYVALLARLVDPATPDVRAALHCSVLGRGPDFACGMLAALLYVRRGSALRARLARSWLARHGGSDLALALVIVVIACVLREVVRRGPFAEVGWFEAWHAVVAAGWSVVVLLLVLAPLRTKPLLASRPVVALGVISYSVYLSHIPIARAAFEHARLVGSASRGWTAETAGLCAAITVGCLALSTVTYHLLERPFLRHRARTPAGAPAA